MEDDFIYQVTIKCDDGKTFIVYTNGGEDESDEILEYMWLKYYDKQPNKSSYSIINLSKDFDELISSPPRLCQVHLACQALDYSTIYN